MVEDVSADRTDEGRISYGVGGLSRGSVLKHLVSMVLHDRLAVTRRVCVDMVGRLRLHVIADKLFIRISFDVKFIWLVVRNAVVDRCIEGYRNSMQYRRLAKAVVV